MRTKSRQQRISPEIFRGFHSILDIRMRLLTTLLSRSLFIDVCKIEMPYTLYIPYSFIFMLVLEIFIFSFTNIWSIIFANEYSPIVIHRVVSMAANPFNERVAMNCVSDT